MKRRQCGLLKLPQHKGKRKEMKHFFGWAAKWIWKEFTRFVGNVWGTLVAAGVAGTVAYLILRWNGLIE